MIFVTNKNDFEHTDRYAGIDYYWSPGEKVAISEEAAAHMFGYGRVDRVENLIRLGWNIDLDAGLAKLRKFVFTKATMVEASEEDSNTEEAA
jgi:hypothetical protein